MKINKAKLIEIITSRGGKVESPEMELSLSYGRVVAVMNKSLIGKRMMDNGSIIFLMVGYNDEFTALNFKDADLTYQLVEEVYESYQKLNALLREMGCLDDD